MALNNSLLGKCSVHGGELGRGAYSQGAVLFIFQAMAHNENGNIYLRTRCAEEGDGLVIVCVQRFISLFFISCPLLGVVTMVHWPLFGGSSAEWMC